MPCTVLMGIIEVRIRNFERNTLYLENVISIYICDEQSLIYLVCKSALLFILHACCEGNIQVTRGR